MLGGILTVGAALAGYIYNPCSLEIELQIHDGDTHHTMVQHINNRERLRIVVGSQTLVCKPVVQRKLDGALVTIERYAANASRACATQTVFVPWQSPVQVVLGGLKPLLTITLMIKQPPKQWFDALHK